MNTEYFSEPYSLLMEKLTVTTKDWYTWGHLLNMDNNNTLVFRQNNGCKDPFKMMSNALYWHIEVIEMTHDKSSFGEIHKVENNYSSNFFGVENEGLQLELSVDFVSFNRYTCRMGGLKHYKKLQSYVWYIPSTSTEVLLTYESSSISNDLSLIIISFKLLSVHPLLSCPRQPSTLYLFCQYTGCFMGTLTNFR